MNVLFQNLQEQVAKDYKLLKQLEDKLRWESDPRFIGKWESEIKDIKQKIRVREAEIDSYVSYRVSYCNSNQSNIEENSKYFNWTIEELENLEKRHQQNIDIIRQEYQDLNYNIKAKMVGMKTEKDGERVYKYTTEINELKTKIKEVLEELESKEQYLRDIKKEIEQKKIT